MWQLLTAFSERSETIIKGEGEIWQFKGRVAGYKERRMCLQAAAECDEAGKAPQADRLVQEKETGTPEQVQEAWVAGLPEDWDPEMWGGHTWKSSEDDDEECSMAHIQSQMVPQELWGPYQGISEC